jgi:hypothetical protein
MLATLDHRDIARRNAPRTSLPILISGPGELSELDKAMGIRFFDHLI